MEGFWPRWDAVVFLSGVLVVYVCIYIYIYFYLHTQLYVNYYVKLGFRAYDVFEQRFEVEEARHPRSAGTLGTIWSTDWVLVKEFSLSYHTRDL